MARLLRPTRQFLALSSRNPASLLSKFRALCSIHGQDDSNAPTLIQLPQIIPSNGEPLGKDFSIELVDSDLWSVSFGLAEALDSSKRTVGGLPDVSPAAEECRDFDDEIEDLRLRKKLFYKLDKGSKEFEEYSFSFHRRTKSSSKRNSRTESVRQRDCEKLDKKKLNSKALCDDSTKIAKQKANILYQEKVRSLSESGGVEGKRVRTPTFNQLTDPYHLPFCLDIFITKGSVRACIIHRITSKVVTVAHSISKDMKFDLNSRRDTKACAAVGAVLAKRAIEDDIYNVMYTPRKGDKIEGKIEIVLQSITEHGVDVKVKLKQTRPMKKAPFVQVDQA
ncbi:uncharacterized protein [Typha angustifolia]|uniref:uncharacterized protein n=1 Tax=Typha angustifolia TaxID=59011 RepID=UPI003C2F144D